jgi:hypothetical protein
MSVVICRVPAAGRSVAMSFIICRSLNVSKPGLYPVYLSGLQEKQEKNQKTGNENYAVDNQVPVLHLIVIP